MLNLDNASIDWPMRLLKGVKAGDTIAVMDWDSHRYLECFYAIPMLGAVLHTVNIRLSPEQILYTIDHAEDDYILMKNGAKTAGTCS
jgi:acyl-CoA synthetase (AMP-forming)/AMP-acid ligase II